MVSPRAVATEAVELEVYQALLGQALLHVAHRLPDLEETCVGLVVDRVGVDARTGFRLGREDLLDGLTHHPRPSDG